MQERLGVEPHTRLRFFCSPYHQDSALYPAIAQLERAAGFRREDTPHPRTPVVRHLPRLLLYAHATFLIAAEIAVRPVASVRQGCFQHLKQYG
jgi:hypothetical protein